MPNILITGASRGIGREFVRQYAADGWRVFACCRNPAAAEELNALAAASEGRVTVHTLDVDDGASVAALRTELASETFDVLINNAGIIGTRGDGLGDMDYDAWAATMNTNVFGPMRVAEAFAAQIGGEKKLITISSQMGSIANAKNRSIVYRSSKAAVNMVMACLSKELVDRGIVTVVFHPGHVQTDMGGSAAPVTPNDSVAGMRGVIAGLTPAENGHFLNYDGSEIAW